MKRPGPYLALLTVCALLWRASRKAPTVASDPMAARTAALYRFRGAYGRLCRLMAQALSQNFNAADVIAAGQGAGENDHLQLRAIRHQRQAVNRALTAARTAGAEVAQIVNMGREAKRAVETEWDVDIPITARS